jgi:hypothetical protein
MTSLGAKMREKASFGAFWRLFAHFGALFVALAQAEFFRCILGQFFIEI